MNGKRIAGRNYVPSCGRCDVLPWELCACSDARLLELNARTVAPVRIEARERMAERIEDRLNDEARSRLEFVLCE